MKSRHNDSTRPVRGRAAIHTSGNGHVARILALALLLAGPVCIPAAHAQAPAAPQNVRIIAGGGDPVPSTAKVTVSPSSVSLPSGLTQRFTATVTGTSTTSVTWTATGGSISSDGTYRAGSVAGTYRVTATIPGSSVYATATVAVLATPLIAVSPGQDIQALVNANANGTGFLIKAGVHRRQQIRPKSGMAFYGEPGAVLDGENATAHAFETLSSAPTGVVIRGLIIERYVPPLQKGAIQGDNGQNWRVEENEVRNNANHGLRAGPGMQVLRNKVHHNGVIGIAGYLCDNVLVEGNEVSYNNTLQAPEDPILAEASGIKFLKTRNLVVRGNHVHHNLAKGIWTDHAWPTTTIESNTVTDNSSSGIWHEVSYDAVIRYNRVERNGGSTAGSWLARAGIQITNSPNVTVHGNLVTNNANGIGVMQSTGYVDGPYGANVVQNLHVYDNTVTMSVGRTGLAQNVGDTSVYTSRNNRFTSNTYHLGTLSTYFLWNERALDERGWQSAGQDLTGRFIR